MLGLVTFAQNTGNFKTTATSTDSYQLMKSASDSVICTNAGTSHLYITMRQKSAASVQIFIVKTSGTLGGTVTFYGSNDGINYVALTDATSTPTVTTYTVTDTGTYAAPQTTIRYLVDHPVKFLRVTWVGTGTMSGWMKAKVNAG